MHSVKTAIVVVGKGGSGYLRKSLERALAFSLPIVYVDMASVDDSTEVARKMGVPVLELSIDRSISRARACNEGANFILKKFPEIQFVQFIRVGCILDEHWIVLSEKTFQDHPRLGALSGLTYSQDRKGHDFVVFAEAVRGFLGDLNGGDFICRLSILKELKGFDIVPRLGFETEFVVRMQSQKFYSQRLPQRMLEIDAGFLKHLQRIKASYRQGYIQYYMTFKAPKLSQRIIFLLRSLWVSLWSFWIPLAMIYFAVESNWEFFFKTFASYLILAGGFFIRRRLKVRSFESFGRSFFMSLKSTVGFFARLWGHLKAFSDLSNEETSKIFSAKKKKNPRIPL